MKSYPYIGEGKNSGSIALIYDKAKCITLESKTWASDDLELCEGIKEECFKNITSKHLERKCVEVKSKEHGDFMQQLAFNANYLWAGLSSEKRNISSGYLIFGRQSTIISYKTTKPSIYHELITIPLPPKEYLMKFEEREDEASKYDEWPKVGDAVFAGSTKGYIYSPPDEDGTYVIATPQDGEFIFAKRSELSKEPKNQQLDEWPKVNDEVLFQPNPSQPEKIKAKIKYIGDKFTVLQSESGREFSRRNAKLLIEKPKTPEQDLFESFWREVGLFMNHSNLNKKIFESAFINNITKKPQ